MIVGENPDVLFQGLVDMFCLSITFQVVTGSEMEFHVQGFSKRSKEVRDKLGAMIRRNMGRNTVFGKYMDNEELVRNGSSLFHGIQANCASAREKKGMRALEEVAPRMIKQCNI